MNDTPMLQPGAHSCARVAYRASREEVEAMLAQGHSIRTVYEHLKAQGRAPCSYSAFCDYVRGQGQRKHSKGKKRSPLRPDSRSMSTTTNMGKPFVYDPSSVDIKTLV